MRNEWEECPNCGVLSARIDDLEAQLQEANEIIDANRWPDTAAKLLREAEARAEAAEMHADKECELSKIALANTEKALAEAARLRDALRELDWHNPLHNDLDGYLHDLAQWGLGKAETRPNPAEYGLNILVPDAEQSACDHPGRVTGFMCRFCGERDADQSAESERK